MTEFGRTIPAAAPLLERWLRALKALYRRSLREDTRRRIRNTIKRVAGKRAKKALAYMPPVAAKALSTNPANAKKLLVAEANELAAAWRLGEALAKVDAALSIGPSQAAYRLRATILANMGDKAQSAAASRNLLALNPLDIAGYRQLKALGEEHPPVSLEIALEAVKGMGGTSTAHLRAAEYLYFFGLFSDVLQVCEMGLAVNAGEKPSDRQARSLYNLLLHKGYALEGLHQHETAVRLYEETAAKSFEVRNVIPIARCLLEVGDPAKGIAMLRRAHAGEVDPQPFHPLTMDLLQANGDIREAYALYRKRPISLALAKAFKAEKHPLDLNILSKEYRNKKALILSEGGPADELRMCAVYEELASCFDHLTITCEPRLKGIMERNFSGISFLPTARHRREIVKDMSDRSMLTDARLFQLVSDQVIIAAKDADLVCSLLDTLADLRPDREAFRKTKRAPLKPDPTLRKYWAAKTKASGRTNIGLSWRSMLQSVARDRHYLTVKDLKPLSDVDADFWLFQPGATQEEIDYLRSFLALHIPEGLDLVNDLEAQLAYAASLDFVISPFATTGELAGAVGTPTFLVSTTKSTTWRRSPDGSDLWHAKTKIVWGDPVHDRVSAMQAVADKLQARIKRRRRVK
jgi:tetratricopeptide (TPR) repeat protein